MPEHMILSAHIGKEHPMDFTEKTASAFSPDWLADPYTFGVNRIPPYADHLVFATEQEADRQVSSLVKSLDGMWHAHFAMRPADAPDSLITGDAGVELMEIPVPCNFQLVNPEWDKPQYTNVQYPWDGWENLEAPQVSDVYNPTVTAVRRFTMAAEELQQASRVVLNFLGAEAALAVWLNGAFVGYGEDSFTPTRFDVTDHLRPGENRLVARVFKRCSGSWIEDQDFWRMSGIHRSVTLTMEPRTHLEDIFVTTPLHDNYTQGTLQAALKIRHPQGQVTLTLVSPAGDTVAQETRPAEAEMEFSLASGKVATWTAETPVLYRLTVTLADDQGTAEVSRVAVGFRMYEMKDKMVCVNGRRIVFHGVNRHEFDPDHGRVPSREMYIRDLTAMKELNINAIRTSHYPNDSLLYALCDEYGFYVVDETNLESHGSWGRPGAFDRTKIVPGDRADYLPMTLDRGRSMLERDKNHPCILFWSCGNEAFGGKDLFLLSEYFRHRDPTRLVHYEGVYNDMRYPGTNDVYSRMYCRVDEIERIMQGNPQKPFINIEYIHAMGNSMGGMYLYTALEDKYPMYQGGFIWDWVDQAFRQKLPDGRTRWAYGGDFGDRPADYQFIGNGVVFPDRSHSPKGQEVKFLFQGARLTPEVGGVTVTNTHTFRTLCAYDLQWTVQLDGHLVDGGAASLPVIHPGETVRISAPIALPQEQGEAVATAWLVLREQEGLLPKGYDVAHGQTILRSAAPHIPSTVPAPAPIRGDFNLGMHSKGFHALFGYVNGGLTSLRNAAGREMLLRAPWLSLFRAPTENDKGNQDALRQGIWHAFSRHSHARPMEAPNGITYRYESPVLPEGRVDVAYAMEGTDALRVTFQFQGVKGQPDLQALGLSFQLDPRLNLVTYYGNGPDETYADRKSGALLGQYTFNAATALTPYITTQECGNRTEVRWLTLTDAEGHGLELSMVDCPLEVSVLPYLPEELAAAAHPDELALPSRTVLDIAMKRKGVGGDDSWGAPVLPPYCIPSDRDYSFSFLLRVR